MYYFLSYSLKLSGELVLPFNISCTTITMPVFVISCIGRLDGITLGDCFCLSYQQFSWLLLVFFSDQCYHQYLFFLLIYIYFPFLKNNSVDEMLYNFIFTRNYFPFPGKIKELKIKINLSQNNSLRSGKKIFLHMTFDKSKGGRQ